MNLLGHCLKQAPEEWLGQATLAELEEQERGKDIDWDAEAISEDGYAECESMRISQLCRARSQQILSQEMEDFCTL